jgi:tetratricopeptide (TPR) repeat protein
MKKYSVMMVFVLMLLAFAAPSGFGQSTGTVKGACKDVEGKPIAGGIVIYTNLDSGQKYSLKTNNKGEYFSLGIQPGSYLVSLYKTAEDLAAGKDLFHFNKFQVQLDENTLDFDMKKQQAEQAKGTGMTAEQIKQQQEAQAKQQKEQGTVKALNDKLNAANTAAQTGDYDTAIASLSEANQTDPSHDLIWFKLGDYERLSANKQTDPAEKQKRLDAAVTDYQKAVQLKQATVNDKDPDAGKKIAAYYNNLAEAYAKTGKVDDAVKTYMQAAQADPATAGQYYFNIGAVLTNAGKVDDAIAAFDKVIAADPTRADAYYWKGVNLIGKETMDKDNKAIAPPGTAEAFQKYLELQPTGQYAEPAKGMLASIGAPVEVGFGKKKAPPKK